MFSLVRPHYLFLSGFLFSNLLFTADREVDGILFVVPEGRLAVKRKDKALVSGR